MQTTLLIKNMNCAHCEKAISNALEDLGVANIHASATNKTVEFSFDPSKLTLDDIEKEIIETGYEIG